MKVYWQDPEQSILVREFPKEWQWSEFTDSVLRMRQMLAEVKHPVYIILDARRVQVIPRGALSYFSDANQNLPVHVMMRILVSQNMLLRALYTVLARTVPHHFENFYHVMSMEAACAKIARFQEMDILV